MVHGREQQASVAALTQRKTRGINAERPDSHCFTAVCVCWTEIVRVASGAGCVGFTVLWQGGVCGVIVVQGNDLDHIKRAHGV